VYFRFNPSHRDREASLAERGIQMSYETIRQRCRTFGQVYTEHVRRRRPGPAGKWHVDELQLAAGSALGSCAVQAELAVQVEWVPPVPVLPLAIFSFRASVAGVPAWLGSGTTERPARHRFDAIRRELFDDPERSHRASPSVSRCIGSVPTPNSSSM
jgi:hypothetical protein